MTGVRMPSARELGAYGSECLRFFCCPGWFAEDWGAGRDATRQFFVADPLRVCFRVHSDCWRWLLWLELAIIARSAIVPSLIIYVRT